MWLEPIQALHRRKTNESWTDKHGHVMSKLVEKHRLYRCPSWREVGNKISEGLGKWQGACKNTSKEGLGTWQRRHDIASSKWTYLEDTPSVSRWESEKRRGWIMPVEGFRDHVTTPMALCWESGHVECVWVVSGAAWSWRGGTLDAELEVQRTTKRAAPTALLCLLRGIIGPPRPILTTKVSLTGCGEEKRSASAQKAKGTDF